MDPGAVHQLTILCDKMMSGPMLEQLADSLSTGELRELMDTIPELTKRIHAGSWQPMGW